jgi:hypothetical protein
MFQRKISENPGSQNDHSFQNNKKCPSLPIAGKNNNVFRIMSGAKADKRTTGKKKDNRKKYSKREPV